MAKKADQKFRDELIALLNGGNAHMGFEDAIAGFPIKAINDRAPHVNHTFWHLLEHMRRAQYDILEFIRNPDYISPDYSEFWPVAELEATAGQWKKTISEICSDMKAAIKIVKDPETNFFSPIPHAKDYNIFREILLIADHNAYHIAELLALRQVMNISPKSGW